MLRELHISNLAVIADARIELSGGLNCFTGATGAGKSLVIGAIEVLLGMRSPAEMLRAGADEGRVSGVFEVRDARLLESLERITDVPVRAEGGELLLTRRLYASGRTSVALCGHPITLGMLKQVAEAGITGLVVTDTVPIDPLHRPENMTVLSVGELLADTIMNVFADDSVSAIFGGENQLF